MTDIETILADHLAHTAEQATPRPDLARVLADAARPDANAGTGLHAAVRDVPRVARRRWVVLAAAAVIAVGLAVAAAGTSGDRAPDVEAGPSAVTTMPGNGTSPTPPSTPTTSGSPVRPPPEPVTLTTATDGPVPVAGFAVLTDDTVTLFTLDGALVGTGIDESIPGWSGGRLVVEQSGDETVDVTVDPAAYRDRGLAGDECVELDGHAAGTVQACTDGSAEGGGFGRTLRTQASDGTTLFQSGLVNGLGVNDGHVLGGHWSEGFLSPDGRWLLAEWSGECEVPAAVLIRTSDASVRRASDGVRLADGIDEPVPQSRALGWAGDRAVVATYSGSCGTANRSDVALVDPDTGEHTSLVPLADGPDGVATDRVVPWRLVDDSMPVHPAPPDPSANG